MRKTLFFICFTFLFAITFSQDRFTARGYFGFSDLRFIIPDGWWSTFPEYAPYYAWKTGIYYDLINSNSSDLYPTLGISLSGRTTREFYRDQNDILRLIHRDKFYTFDLPLELNYQIYKSLIIKSGLNGSVVVMFNTMDLQGIRQLFTYGFSVGASLQLNRYSLYLEYNRDLNDILKHNWIKNCSWRFSSVNIGFGYHFSSFKQFKGVIR